MVKSSFLFLLIVISYSCSNSDTKTITNNQQQVLKNYGAIKDETCGLSRELLIKFNVNDTLVGYKNEQGKIVIPANYCVGFEDTFQNHAIVMNFNYDIIGVDSKNHFMYDVYIFDMGPDYVKNNRFRIVKDDKIGFANGITGCIEISPSFSYAEYFNEGLATFCIGGKLIKEDEHG